MPHSMGGTPVQTIITPRVIPRNGVREGHDQTQNQDLRETASTELGAGPLFGNPPATSLLSHQPVIQAKLEVGSPDDPLEQEADQMADQVVQRMALDAPPPQPPSTESKPSIQRKCADCEQDEVVQAKFENPPSMIRTKGMAGISTASPEVSSQIHASKGGGNALPPALLTNMQAGFGQDLSQVRLHTDGQAATLSRELNARAFTVGRDIYFGAGQYQPESKAGQHLLAHELTHTLQQGAGKTMIQRRTFRDRVNVSLQLDPVMIAHAELIVSGAPEEDSEAFQNFLFSAHEGIARVLSTYENHQALTRSTLRIRMRYRANLSDEQIMRRAEEATERVLPATTTPTRIPSGPVTPTVEHLPQDPTDQPRVGETDAERIRRQINTSMITFANMIADASVQGRTRVTLTIQNNGREIFPGYQAEGDAPSRDLRGPTTARSVRETLRNFQGEFEHAGRWRIVFERRNGSLGFVSFNLVPEEATPTPRSDEDELRELGIPNRSEIYGQIFQEAEQQLQEAGMMIAGFAVEQIVLWVAGGVLLRGLGLLGRGAMAGFPRLAALLSAGETTAVASGLRVLSRTERAEFSVLMGRVESGALNAAERTHLEALLTRVEGALPASSRATSAAAAMARIRVPNVTSLNGSVRTFDQELVRRAAEIRATQAGLSQEAFTSYNVAVARVRTASGDIVYLEAGNNPGGLHSEEYILDQLSARVSGLGRGARVEQLYSERIPCTNCSDIIGRYFGQGTEVYYTVGNIANRGEALMRAYGLIP